MFSARMFFEKGLCLSEEHIITRLADESKIKMVKKGDSWWKRERSNLCYSS